MKLAVVIVNYNVRYFLEQCLHSVRKAAAGLAVEVYVVDNNSVDRSVEMVREKFPEVIVIANKENKGFSYANNQAMRITQAEYVLLLNPDTVVEEDTFRKVLDFMDTHPDAGGLGVKMIDGKGIFLPESKRGLPTPEVAFYKIFGLSALFPKSERFGKYHLGFLDRDKVHEVEVLSGAFMLMRKEALDKVGLLDEAFFMYGEDIDLSYRIIKGGYKNYYFPDTRIIHYKGESTKKSSVNYVFVFYNAMIIFARKHFSQKNARLFSVIINFAIYLRAFVAILNRFLKKVFLPIMDFGLIFGGIWLIKNYWESTVKVAEGLVYPREFMMIEVPLCILIWQTSVYLSGGYDPPVRLRNIFRGMLVGTLIVLVLYSLLPENYRYSRAIIVLGAVWAILGISLFRWLLHLSNRDEFRMAASLKKRMLICGKKDEVKRVYDLLLQTTVETSFVGFVNSENSGNNSVFLGGINQLGEMIEIYKIDEVVFCAKDIPSQQIIDIMSQMGRKKVDYKIAPPESLYIIGSSSIEKNGDFYTVDINGVNKPHNQRNKRIFDLVASVSMIPLFPVLLFFVDQPFGLLMNIFSVLLGKKSWVGYFIPLERSGESALPNIRPGVLSPYLILKQERYDEELNSRMNLLYAKDYKVENDFSIVMKGIRLLGRR